MLAYTFHPEGDTVLFKIHFGAYAGTDDFSPLQVGFWVESKQNRDAWAARITEAQAAGRLPVGTKIQEMGKQTVHAFKEWTWTSPEDLNDELLENATQTLLKLESIFGAGKIP
jgi:hypothetical protein